jgi:transcriptional regulator with XRE-family HTH domain
MTLRESTLADLIRTAIADCGWTNNQLAVRSGVDRATIGRFLKGERTVTVETANRLLVALGCAVKIGKPRPRAGGPNPIEEKKPAAGRRESGQLEKKG